ncbi:hypothetical protein H4R34_003809 [Dimargaris verticillata]|uniref:Uncharacterized protein n=1 Tax=Dimargaris verticillata TaxID=2761393 RepID=A0A9W8AZC1_9FUNG|nr:hypothetical protein H4R34_003809 [Dimargaris verticillata]
MACYHLFTRAGCTRVARLTFARVGWLGLQSSAPNATLTATNAKWASKLASASNQEPSIRSVSTTATSPNQPQAPLLVFEGPSCRAVRILKVFSLTGTTAALTTVPMLSALWGTTIPPTFGVSVFAVGSTIMSSVATTTLLNALLHPYITRIFVHWPPTNQRTKQGPELASASLPRLSLLSPLSAPLSSDPAAPAIRFTPADAQKAPAAKTGTILSSLFTRNPAAANRPMSAEEVEGYRHLMRQRVAEFPIEMRPDTFLTLETLSIFGRPRHTTLRIQDLTPSTRFMRTWQIKAQALTHLPRAPAAKSFWLEWKSNITQYEKINEAIVWRIGQLIHENREYTNRIE